LYNATYTFNKAVALNDTDSVGQELNMFGQRYTISADTSSTDLVLLKSAEKVSLTSDNPTTEVTVGGNTYTVELVSASDSAATIKVTDSNGNSDTKEVNENKSKKIQGLTVAITSADETNLKLSATLIAGADKITLVGGSSVTTGDNADTVDGTTVRFTGTVDALTKIVIEVVSDSSDEDFMMSGGNFVDPVFGSFKVDFASLNIADTSSDREDIIISNNGDDKAQLTLTDHAGNEGTVTWAKNYSTSLDLQGDNDGRNITVFEGSTVYRNEFVVVGNEEEGHLLKVSSVTNQSTGYSNDKVRFTDVFSGETYDATLSGEGAGTVTVGGKVYTITYNGDSSASDDSRNVTINYPDSTGSGAAVIYPTIQTSKGALVSFYEPVTIDLDNWDGSGTNLATLRFPDGDGYTDVTFASPGGIGNWTLTGGASDTLDTNSTRPVIATIGQFTYNFTTVAGSPNITVVYMNNPSDGSYISTPALQIIEEKDDNANYEGMVVTLEPGMTSDDGLGVNAVDRTWGNDNNNVWGNGVTLASDSKITKKADLYGSIITIDASDSDQTSATISYPDEQVTALIYLGENTASIDTGVVADSATSTSVKVLGSVSLSDSDAAQVTDKNLIVVGGSCVNSIAAELLGGSLCGSDFEAKTSVNAGSFLIETFSRTGGKVATLVAGYNAGDTTNAAKFLTTQSVDTSVGKKYVGSSATTATLVSGTAATTDTTTNVAGQ
jgi:hypothetical protein